MLSFVTLKKPLCDCGEILSSMLHLARRQRFEQKTSPPALSPASSSRALRTQRGAARCGVVVAPNSPLIAIAPCSDERNFILHPTAVELDRLRAFV